ncbi:MAG: hypothetical protein Fur0023_12060 [Bacteroidia bacterium]
MFNSCYRACLKNKENINDTFFRERHIYTFKSNYNRQVYIIECFFRDEFLCSITFYLKSHRHSPNKYKLKTHLNDFARIIRTCLNVFSNELKKHPYLSLLIEAVYSVDEQTNQASKRQRIYIKVLQNFFSPETFDIIEYKNYILLFNKSNPHLKDILSEIKLYINKT